MGSSSRASVADLGVVEDTRPHHRVLDPYLAYIASIASRRVWSAPTTAASMAASRVAHARTAESSLGSTKTVVGPTLEQAEIAAGDRVGGAAGPLDDRRCVPHRHAPSNSSRVLPRLEVPVEAGPVDAEALGERQARTWSMRHCAAFPERR